MQQNNKCRLYAERDETIYHIISEHSKLAQKQYKTRHNWVGKVIYCELRNKFDHRNKWYIHNPASVPENEAHIQTDDLITARRQGRIIIKKERK